MHISGRCRYGAENRMPRLEAKSKVSPILKIAEQVADRNNPDDLAILRDGQVPDTLFSHEVAGLMCGAIDLDCNQGTTHDLANPLVSQVEPPGHCFPNQVGLRHHSQIRPLTG